MIKGLYSAASSMITLMKKMDVISNNIANVDTTAFKRDIFISQSFSEELIKRIDNNKINSNQNIGSMNLGVSVQNIYTDFQNGGLEKTENKLNFAIRGDGFFCIETLDENDNIITYYTKDGNFRISPEGHITTSEGYTVLGENGQIKIDTSEFYVDNLGNIKINQQYIDKFQIVNFENKDLLKKIGNNLYEASQENNFVDANYEINQGFLESSNVNSIKEMIEMISLSRVFEANQKTISTHDNTLQRAVNDIARR